MHKNFYASGFLYHPGSSQILLQQNGDAKTWMLFESANHAEEEPEETFLNLINDKLHLKMKRTKIFPVYRYFHDEKNANNFLYYGLLEKLKDLKPTSNTIFSWFSFKQIQKLQLPEQVKHDIVVGQRVIDSEMRRSLGQQTIG